MINFEIFLKLSNYKDILLEIFQLSLSFRNMIWSSNKREIFFSCPQIIKIYVVIYTW